MSKDLIETIKELDALADQGCDCTEAQGLGHDKTLCKSCMACASINYMAEIARGELEDIND